MPAARAAVPDPSHRPGPGAPGGSGGTRSLLNGSLVPAWPRVPPRAWPAGTPAAPTAHPARRPNVGVRPYLGHLLSKCGRPSPLPKYGAPIGWGDPQPATPAPHMGHPAPKPGVPSGTHRPHPATAHATPKHIAPSSKGGALPAPGPGPPGVSPAPAGPAVSPRFSRAAGATSRGRAGTGGAESVPGTPQQRHPRTGHRGVGTPIGASQNGHPAMGWIWAPQRGAPHHGHPGKDIPTKAPQYGHWGTGHPSTPKLAPQN